MIVLDSQVHSWYSDRIGRPWDVEYRRIHRDKPSYLQHAGQTNSPEMVLAEMAEVGVDGALLVPVGVYGTSMELELEAADRAPDRFQVVGLVDHLDSELGEQLSSARARGLRGLRLLGLREPERVARGEFERVLRLCADLDLVVMLSLAHPLDGQLPDLFARHRDVFFYIDHLGTGFAPPILGFRPADPFLHLTRVIGLATLANVGVKLTGAPALSSEGYPFRDIWDPVQQLIAGFGADRISWGSDYTRTAALHAYWEGKEFLGEIPGLSSEQLSLLYGETLMLRTGWTPSPALKGGM